MSTWLLYHIYYYLRQGGYVFTLCPVVLWLVGQQDYTKTTEQISTKLRRGMGHGTDI